MKKMKKAIALALSFCMVLAPIGLSADEIVFEDPATEEQTVFGEDSASGDVAYVEEAFSEDDFVSEEFSEEDYVSDDEDYVSEEESYVSDEAPYSSYEESTAYADIDFGDVDDPVIDDNGLINEEMLVDVVVTDDSTLADTIDAATKAVQKQIDALPDAVNAKTKDKANADKAQAAYEALTSAQQANITPAAVAKLEAYDNIEYVAQNKSTKTKYISLAEAISSASSGDTIVALDDIEETGAITVSKTLTIDGGNNDITPQITVNKNTLSIIDGTFKTMPAKTGKGTLSISDGYFPGMVDYDDCATGYYPVKTNSGKYTVTKGTVVASVGSGDNIEFYKTFKAAAEEAGTATITLLANIDSVYDLKRGELKVNKNKKTLNVTTSVTGKSVYSTVSGDVTTYYLDEGLKIFVSMDNGISSVLLTGKEGFSHTSTKSEYVYMTADDTVNVEPTARSGYVVDSYPRSVKIKEDTSITVTSRSAFYSVSVSASSGASASPSCSVDTKTTHEYGTSVKVTAAAAANGYVFDGWYESNSKVSSSSTYTFSLTKNTSLTAIYLKVITVTAPTEEVEFGTEYKVDTSKVVISGLKSGDKESNVVDKTKLAVTIQSGYSKTSAAGSSYTLTPSGVSLKSSVSGYSSTINYVNGKLTVVNNAAVDAFVAEVNALPEATKATTADRANVDKAKADYAKLTADQQKLVAVVSAKMKLDAVEAAVKAAEEKETADKAAAEAVTKAINALPSTISVTDKDQLDKAKSAITAARTAYDALTPDQKKLVTDTTKLTKAEADLANAEKVEPVVSAVNNLPETIDETNVEAAKKAIEAARAAYDALTDGQKELVPVPTTMKLNRAERNLEAAEKALADKAAADAVAALINALPEEVSVDDEEKISKARAAYDELSDDQKKLIPDELKKLKEAEEDLEEAKQYVIDKAKAEEFTAAVGEIQKGAVGEQKGKTDEASAIYTTLTWNQMKLVSDETFETYHNALQAFKTGLQFCSGDGYYKVLENGNVSYIKPADKNCKNAAVPNQVLKRGFLYKVEKVSNTAFMDCPNLKWVVIHKNIESLGAYVFKNTPSLVRIKVIGENLGAGGVANAFVGGGKNKGESLTVKVPAGYVGVYTALFKGEGGLNEYAAVTAG